MISADHISKSFGGQVLFEDASFKLNSRERMGIVGRNGHGKTTLFRLIAGEDQPDGGAITIPRHYRIGYVQQHIHFTQDTVLEEGMTGLLEDERDHHWKVEKVLAGLGFSTDDMQRPPGEFSGGYQVRLNLAKVLVSEPDLLLLDEPTNYLDITSIRWVESFLNGWSHELLLITHDRGFMDKVVTHTLGVNRRSLRKIKGNTEKYYEQIALEEEVYEKTRVNDEKRKKEIQLFISRFRAKARLANMVQSRVKTLSKMEKKDKLEKLKTLDFSFQSKPFAGKQMFSAGDLSFGYDTEKPLIDHFDLIVRPGDRICVIGKNGKGKTTLLKLLADRLVPRTGKIDYHNKVTLGFFEQTNIESLIDTRTVEEEILYSAPSVDRQKSRNICGAMMFEGDAALKKISVLSGGEKSRVMLGKLLVTPVNLLLLDEPTNHLDMESTDAMVAALDNFEGAVIMVTHNEMFLHALAERLIVFQDGDVAVFEGSYQEFLEKGGWNDEGGPIRSARKTARDAAPQTKQDKKEMRRQRSALALERAKVLKPIQKQISGTEKTIKRHEEMLESLNNDMLDASQKQDRAKITETSQSIHQTQKEIDENFDRLESLTESLETQTAKFENEQRS